MAFSGALTLTDLNDFITPAQACIKPLEQTNSVAEWRAGEAETEIRIDAGGAYYEVAAGSSTGAATGRTVKEERRRLETAQINLNDCLACSGCITSAESVLITLQSHREVLAVLEGNPAPGEAGHRLPVFSIAPQSLAAFAAALSSEGPGHGPAATPPMLPPPSPSGSAQQTTPLQILRRVRAFCSEELGVHAVFDTTFARELALGEHVREFEERRRRSSHSAPGESDEFDVDGALPMLASACPGWICYAEKAHAEMLPFVARTKSPQQVMGTLVKEWMGAAWGKLPNEIYHVTVMPCYDKKLEASRQDFYSDVYATRDVDCVITTGELEMMMHEKGWDISLPAPHELDRPQLLTFPPDTLALPELLQHPGSSSGSYLHAILAYVMRTSAVPLSLAREVQRNADYEEYVLADGQRVVFRGARCYGFRNLQNVVRKVGRERGVRVGVGAAGKLGGRGRAVMGRRGRRGGADAVAEATRAYDYVEVMACPGGCVNGGGQLKPPRAAESRDAEGYKRDWDAEGVAGLTEVENGVARWGDKAWTQRIEDAYWRGMQGPHEEHDGTGRAVEDIVGQLCEGTQIEREARRRTLLRTQYRAVESNVVGLAVKW